MLIEEVRQFVPAGKSMLLHKEAPVQWVKEGRQMGPSVVESSSWLTPIISDTDQRL